MDYTTVIAAASIALNGIFAWIWYRRREIRATVRKAMAAYQDKNVTEDEFWGIMDELETVMTKGKDTQ